MLHQLKLRKFELGFDRNFRPSLTNMKKISIEIPIKDNGEFNFDAQRDIASKIEQIEHNIELLRERMAELEELSIELDLPADFIVLEMRELFDFPETNSGITKKFCKLHEGNIPVYGCSKSDYAILGKIKPNMDGIKYHKNSLTWNRNGSVGRVFFRKGVFATNEDHRVMILKEGYRKVIDPVYIKYILENEIKKLGFSFTNKLGKGKMELISIKIPVDKNNNISLAKQIKLREKYEEVNSLKKHLINHLYDLNKASITVEL